MANDTHKTPDGAQDEPADARKEGNDMARIVIASKYLNTLLDDEEPLKLRIFRLEQEIEENNVRLRKTKAMLRALQALKKDE